MNIITLVIISACAFVILLFFGYLLRVIYSKITDFDKGNTDDKNDDFNIRLNRLSIFLLILAAVLILLSFFMPIILTQPNILQTFDFSESGQIGDTIGGIMNPFIALAGVIVTGLAFYMQYKANILQRNIFYKQLAEDKIQFASELTANKQQFDKQFRAQEKQIKVQQFESQFYQMLRLHKENVNEIELFAQRKTVQLNQNLNQYNHYDPYFIKKRNAFVELKKEFEFILYAQAKIIDGKIDKETFSACYKIFFWGLTGFNNDDSSMVEKTVLEYMEPLHQILADYKDRQYDKDYQPFAKSLNFDVAAFQGHSQFLGHYYRHLYHTVKFVVSFQDNLLTYDEIRKYLRVLRSQLSNHEQIMLFYNWLSGYGGNWENTENKFFSEFTMIHNLWYGELFDDCYISDKVKQLRDMPVVHRKTEMFEID